MLPGPCICRPGLLQGNVFALRVQKYIKQDNALGKSPDQHRIRIPPLHTIIFNRAKMKRGKEVIEAQKTLQHKQAGLFFDAMKKVQEMKKDVMPVDHVFNLRGHPVPEDRDQLAQIMCGTLRDMLTCGIASMSRSVFPRRAHGSFCRVPSLCVCDLCFVCSGLPLWLLKRNQRNIRQDLKSDRVTSGRKSTWRDIWGNEVEQPDTRKGPEPKPGKPLLQLMLDGVGWESCKVGAEQLKFCSDHCNAGKAVIKEQREKEFWDHYRPMPGECISHTNNTVPPNKRRRLNFQGQGK